MATHTSEKASNMHMKEDGIKNSEKEVAMELTNKVLCLHVFYTVARNAVYVKTVSSLLSK